jgi:hypothetical protein
MNENEKTAIVVDVMNLVNAILKENHKTPNDITKEDYGMLIDAFNAGFGYAIEKYNQLSKRPLEA